MIYPLASDFLSASTNLPQSFAFVSLSSPFNLRSSLWQYLHFCINSPRFQRTLLYKVTNFSRLNGLIYDLRNNL